MRRVGVFGWGIVAPKSRDVAAFERNLDEGGSWLSAFAGFGPSNFLVGEPDFRFADYKPWIDARFPPSRFPSLEKKMGQPVQYAIGAFVQSLEQNPGLEQELKALGTEAHVYVGTGLGDLDVTARNALALHRAQRAWDRFWADQERNAARREHVRGISDPEAPPEPHQVPDPQRDEAEEASWRYWAARSEALRSFLAELNQIEGLEVAGDVESAKLARIKEKRQRTAALLKKYGAPTPPWSTVSPDLLWNIPNAAAAQVSMMGGITGACFAPVAACSTFGYALKLGMNAITLGEAKAVVVGATDAAPHPLTVAGFYEARVLAADAGVSKPLTGLRGTHVAGGSVVWVLGDLEHMRARGFKPLGLEPLAVGLSADAEHIITPSKHGPISAMQLALDQAGLEPAEVGSWDMHATATPGDFLEVETLRAIFPGSLLVAARKGTFGHGMAACGGWELTAQYLGHARGMLAGTGITEAELNPAIKQVHSRFVYDRPVDAPAGAAGKISMGIGGINACVLSRPWK